MDLYQVRFSLEDGAEGLKSGSLVKVGGQPVGRVTASATPAGRTTFGYDAVGNPVTETTPRGNVAGGTPATAAQHRWTHAYDAAGNRTSFRRRDGGTISLTVAGGALAGIGTLAKSKTRS